VERCGNNFITPFIKLVYARGVIPEIVMLNLLKVIGCVVSHYFLNLEPISRVRRLDSSQVYWDHGSRHTRFADLSSGGGSSRALRDMELMLILNGPIHLILILRIDSFSERQAMQPTSTPQSRLHFDRRFITICISSSDAL
jgi:hypothetical protein